MIHRTIGNYLSLVKFSHTLFAMPFAIIGFVLAIHTNNQPFSLKIFILVILCMVFARSAAMAFNRYIDRRIDEQNPRTQIREIPSGVISARSALWFVILNCLLFIGATYFINPLCFYLSPVALLVILGYSFTKRFTWLCHLILGIGLSLAPIGAYIAVTGKFDLLPVLFSFAVLFWVAGFDIIYALQDEEFDKAQQLRSIPVLMGKKNALRLSGLLHLFTFIIIVYAGILGQFDLWYWSGTAIFSGLLLYQHLIVKPENLSKVNLAFFTTNGIASIIFALFFILGIYL